MPGASTIQYAIRDQIAAADAFSSTPVYNRYPFQTGGSQVQYIVVLRRGQTREAIGIGNQWNQLFRTGILVYTPYVDLLSQQEYHEDAYEAARAAIDADPTLGGLVDTTTVTVSEQMGEDGFEVLRLPDDYPRHTWYSTVLYAISAVME